MNENPIQIALDTLAEVGETPGGDPVAQLRAFADQSSDRLKDMRERMYLTRQPPTDLEEYILLRDRVMTARLAGVRIEAAEERAYLEALLAMPDATHDRETR